MIDSLKKILPYSRPYRNRIIIALLLGMAGSVIYLCVPDMVKNISDQIGEQLYTEIEISSIVKFSCIALIAVLLYFICNMSSARSMVQYGKFIGRDIRNNFNDKLNRITLAKLDTVSSGDLLARLVVDVNSIESAIGRNANTVITNTAILFGTLVMMLRMSVLLTACVILSVLLGTILSTYIKKKTTPLMKTQKNEQSLINANIDEVLTGHMLIKAFNAEEDEINTFIKNNDLLSKHSAKVQFLSSIIPAVMGLTSNLTYVLVVLCGLYLRDMGHTEITIGVIVAFVMYLKIFSNSVSQISNSINPLLQMSISIGRIEEVLNMPEIVDDGQKGISEFKGRVVFDHVKFGYLMDKEIIHDFSAVIEPGMKVAIVGPTGAGKSTIINLLMRFYELNSGSISIDGVNIAEMSRENLHNILGMVLQESWIFMGSVKDNLIYATEGITDERLKEVISKCKLDYFINNLSEGVDTIIKDESISQGQKQLITIARVMLKNPGILILDEATSSVDTRTEKNIQEALDLLMKNKTSFVIAHRLSTIKNADLVFVLKDGDIIETGNHETLMKKGGFYAELYNSQFEKEET